MADEVTDLPTRQRRSTERPDAVPFKLAPGETITDCSPLRVVCDRMAEELGTCCALRRPNLSRCCHPLRS